jgi:pentatricopeptide repeat protein
MIVVVTPEGAPGTARIRLCGELVVELEGRRVESLLEGRDARLALAHLAAQGSQPVERAELGDVLGLRRDDPAAGAALERALAELAGVLGERLVAEDAHVLVRLPADAWIDVRAAEEAARAADDALEAGDPARAADEAQRALTLLDEPYLRAFDNPALRRRRREVDDLRSAALHRLASAALALDPPDPGRAEQAAAELVERRPYRDAGHALLMEALVRQGRADEALEVFDRLLARLRDELGREPGPAIQRLRARLLPARRGAAASSGVAAPGSVPLPSALARLDRRPFVDPDRPLDSLRERWEAARLGEGSTVLLSGEAGIGKTRLAARLAAEADADGATVLYGRADEEAVLPYQPFAEALRHYVAHTPGFAEDPELEPVRRELAGLVPELSPAAPEARERSRAERQRHRLFDAVVRVLRRAADERPLLLVLDDLHWADVPTLLLLREVIRLAPETRMLVLATYRDREVDPGGMLARLLADARREDLVDRVPLAGLDAQKTAALVAASGDREPDEGLARALHEQTGGNPFFIEELLCSWDEAPQATLTVPRSVKEVIGHRLERLDEEVVEVLLTAAVLGPSFRLSALVAVAEDADAVAAVDAGVRAGLIAEDPDDPDRFSFSHQLVRETLYERPVAGRRLRLHRVVAEALEEAPLEVLPGELAHHFFVAREVGGAHKAILYLLQAAERATATHAYEEAIAHYERVLTTLELVRPDDLAARADVLRALGHSRWQASEPDPRAAFDEAARVARRIGSAERLAWAALGAGGRLYAPVEPDPEYLALLEEALRELEPDDSALRSRLLARLAENLLVTAELERAVAVARESVAMARRIGEPDALMVALMSLHAALLHVAHTPERRRLLEEALALAGELEADERAALGRHWLVYDLVELGELDEARRRHAELDALARELRQPLYQHSTLAWRCVWAGLAGRFEEGERLARASLELAEGAGDVHAHMHFTAQLFALRREQGRLDELLEDVERLSAGEGPSAQGWRAWLPLAALDAGDEARARAALDDALAGGLERVPPTLSWLSTVASLAEAAATLRSPHVAELRTALAPYGERLVQASFTGCAGSVHRLLGRLAAAQGDRDAAAGHLEAALERHEALGAAPLQARTRCDLAELLCEGGPAERSRADELFAQAAAAAERLGMRGVAARCMAADH